MLNVFRWKMEVCTVLWTTASLLTAYYVGRCIWFMTYWQRNNVQCYPWITFAWSRMPFHKWIELNYNRFGDVYGFYGGPKRFLVIKDPHLIRDVSITNFHKFAIRNSQYFGTTNVTRSLFFVPAQEDWKRIRSIVTPAFTSGKLRDMCQPIEAILDKFVANLLEEADTDVKFNIKRYCDCMAMDVIARCGYGIAVDSLSNPNHPIVVNARKILGIDATLSQVLCFMFPFIARPLKLQVFDYKATQYFDRLTQTIVEKRIRANEVHNSKDLIGLMMQSSEELDANNNKTAKADKTRDDNNNLKGISMAEISAQSVLFFIAGYDTTNTTLSHAIYYLGKYTAWQEKLYEEIQASETRLDYEHLKSLLVLNAIINETLRLNPPLLIVQREAVQDTYLGDTGILVPKGTIISIQPYCIQRDPRNFPDPLSFKPERFIEDKAESSPAFIPFGVGPRLCVGMRFALNELRFALVKLVKNYRIETNPAEELEYFNGSILMSPKAVNVKLWTRSRLA